MRWEKLFADLEAIAADDELAERDSLVNDLRDGELSATRWLQLVAGQVSLEVAGAGRVDGEVLAGNDKLLHLRTSTSHLLVNPAHVLAILSATERAAANSAVVARLGWPSALRMMQRDQDRVRVSRPDGTVRSGTIDLVGADFFRLRAEGGPPAMIPLAATAVVRCPS